MFSANSKDSNRNESGVALILALLFVVLLTVIVVDFSYDMQVEATLIQHESSGFEAYIAARSAVAQSLGVLAADVLLGEDVADAFDVGLYDGLDEPWAEGLLLTPINDALMQSGIDDEYGKINLNALIYVNPQSGDEEQNTTLIAALQFMMDARGAEVNPVNAILDWLDSDDDPWLDGAESDYYSGLKTPYAPKNGPMDSLEELLLVAGMTPELFFGDPKEGQLPLSELLTVHGHPRGTVNINTARREVLVAVLAGDGNFPQPIDTAESIWNRIENQGPYTTVEELRSDNLLPQPSQEDTGGSRPGPTSGQQSSNSQQPALFGVGSEVFRIRGDGQSGEHLTRIEAFVWRDTYASGSEEMFRILDWRVVR